MMADPQMLPLDAHGDPERGIHPPSQEPAWARQTASALLLTVDVRLGQLDPYMASLLPGSHQVLSVTSEQAALEVLTSQPVDLLVLNDAGGLELLREIHARGHGDLLTIVITVRPSTAVAREAMYLGAYAYLTRPCDPGLLRTMLADACVPWICEETGECDP